MNDNTKLLLKMIKQDFDELLESGAINNPETQQRIIKDKLELLVAAGDVDVVHMIDDYIGEQDILQTTITAKSEELQKPMDQFTTNLKELYEELKNYGSSQ